ncbi:MAG: DUF4142 domain-containing protein [Elusimicrobia bacterium]|nr:DUF4142 domain-containing protein [Elusimicrobiota bacterium]
MASLFGATVAVAGAQERRDARPGLEAEQPPISETVVDTESVESILGKIHSVNQFEIEAGQLAAERGEDLRVRRFGTLLARDHRLSDGKLVDIARAKGYRLELKPPEREDARLLESLRDLRGAEFDKAFLAGMDRGHKKVMDLLTESEGRLEDPAARRYVAKVLPVLHQHFLVAARLRIETSGSRKTQPRG